MGRYWPMSHFFAKAALFAIDCLSRRCSRYAQALNNRSDATATIAGLKRRTGSPGSEISYLLGEPRRKGKQTPERNVLAKRDKVNFVIARNEFSLWAKQ